MLFGGNASVAWNKHSHDTTGGLDALGKRGDIEEKKVLNLFRALTRENGSLDGSAVGNGLIRVDGSVELLSVEEVRKHLLNFGDTG